MNTDFNKQIIIEDSGIKSEMPENFVIVIGRQFGSGGRTIGKIIASRLSIGYYDTELLKKAAEAEGVNADILKAHDEKKPASLFKALLQGSYGIADNFHTVPLSSERVYKAQCKVIKDLSEKGSCVIVGRNADFILRNHPHLLSVFLHAPIEHRVKSVIDRKEADSMSEAMNLALQHDKRRESFYNFYRGEKKWGVASNYDITLDTSSLDKEGVADMIISLAQKKFKYQKQKN